jgi:Flp pilus assembly protein protease CpaA
MGLLKIIWLLSSSFGIMFAFLSWLQESNLIANDLGFYKGLFALILGLVLFFAVPSRMGK